MNEGDARTRRAAVGALVAGCLVLGEAMGALIWPQPLDLELSVIEAILLVLGVGAVGAAVAVPRTPALRGLVLAAVGLVLGPELLRAGGAAALALPLGLPAGLALAAAAFLRAGRIAWMLAGIGLALPALRAAGSAPAPPNAAPATRQMLLITVDTVRADDGLLDDPAFAPGAGVWTYTQAVSAAPWTLPSMLSLLLGEPVERHGGGLVVEGGHSLPAPARWGDRRRFGSVAFVSNPYLRADIGLGLRFAQVFHTDDGRVPLSLVHNARGLYARWWGGPTPAAAAPDARIEAAAAAALRAGAPVVWAHFIAPHEHRRHCVGRFAVRDCAPDAVRALHATLVAETRARVVRLLAVDPTRLAVVVGDHGEAFGEAGLQGHGLALHDPELLVPLAVRVPGGFGGAVHEPVATTSVLGLLEAWVDGAPLRTGRPIDPAPGGKVAVAGLRVGVDAAGERVVGGRVLNRPAIPPADARWVPGDATRAALEALGYLDATGPPASPAAPATTEAGEADDAH